MRFLFCSYKPLFMKTLFAAVIVLLCVSRTSAQSANETYSTSTYDRAIGIKFPGGFAVSYKQFLKDYQNVEAEAMFWNQGFWVVGLYEFNWNIPDIEGLRWYAGGGAHLGFWNNNYSKRSNTSSAGFGLDGVIGLDYKINTLPINVSLDWQPAVDLIGSTGYNAAYGGIGVRYTF